MSALLDVSHVSKSFTRGGLFSSQRIVAVNDVSFQIAAGRPEIFTIIGESGSGKTTLSRMILNIERPTSGALMFDGIDLSAVRSTAGRMAFMRKVGLSLKEVRGRYPHELSGGQLQRVAIARALLSNPKLIVADEPVSMVDASLRMSIVNLFKRLRDDLGISIAYVTHDLATAYYISDRIIVMQKGNVVESGEARAVLNAPQHPYSQQLRAAVLLPEVSNAGRRIFTSM
jgi:ABC-type oligopeptide transport system ATPase subunit